MPDSTEGMERLDKKQLCRCGRWVVAFKKIDNFTFRHEEEDGSISECKLTPQPYEYPSGLWLTDKKRQAEAWQEFVNLKPSDFHEPGPNGEYVTKHEKAAENDKLSIFFDLRSERFLTEEEVKKK